VYYSWQKVNKALAEAEEISDPNKRSYEVSRLEGIRRNLVCAKNSQLLINPLAFRECVSSYTIDIDFTLISDELLANCSLVINQKEVYMISSFMLGEYNCAIYMGIRQSSRASFYFTKEFGNDLTTLLDILDPDRDDSLRYTPRISVKRRTFADFYDFTRRSLDNLPTPMVDGWIKLDDENLKYLYSLTFAD
jgi:hypothetical protein